MTNTAEWMITLVPATAIPSQPWWPALHSTIITAFKTTHSQAYPPTWTRLPQESQEAGQHLTKELGAQGVLAVVLHNDQPIACTGALPFRGMNWIENEKSADDQPRSPVTTEKIIPPSVSIQDWEICCFCVHPSHRGGGISPNLLNFIIEHVKSLGARRLYANYAIEETGDFWTHMGFEIIPDAGGVLRKGFTVKPEGPGLLEDIYFAMAAKVL